MSSKRKPQLSLTKAKGVHVYKCLFPKCSNFFTSTSNQSVKYCHNHAHYPTSKTFRSFLLSSLILLVFAVPVAYAADFNDRGVIIKISRSCEMIPTCVSYSDLLPLDNSNQDWTGKLDENGKRKPTQYKNSHYLYINDNAYRIFIDAPVQYEKFYPVIEIVPRLDEFHIPSLGHGFITEYKVTSDALASAQLRSYAHTRYMEPSCGYAVISAKFWHALLPDTISYMRNYCDEKHTNFKTITIESKPLTIHDIATSAKYKLEKEYDYIIKNCTKDYGACKTSNLGRY
jgi:hypothetical protein